MSKIDEQEAGFRAAYDVPLTVAYEFDELDEFLALRLDHSQESQGAEYPAVVTPAAHAALPLSCSATSSTRASCAASGSSFSSGSRKVLALAVGRGDAAGVAWLLGGAC